MKQGRPAAFFDLDGTLLTVNSGRLWMESERRQGRISLRETIEAIFYLAAYQLGVVNIERAMERALGTVIGVEEDVIRTRTHDWYESEVKQYAAPGAWDVLNQHRQDKHSMVLLTSSSPYESEVAKLQFGLEHALSTKYETFNGRFTGKVNGSICFGHGKVEFAERYAEEHGIDLSRSYFYSDSVTDVPMLERVGEPRVVNPDMRLKRVAKRRGWKVLNWS